MTITSAAAIVRLVVGERAYSFSPGRAVSIGRAKSCDVVVGDDRVSRTHATLTWDVALGAWVLADAGSSNGVYVNGARITAARLASGDSIRLGDQPDAFELLVFFDAGTVPSGGAGRADSAVTLSETVIGKSADADFILTDVLVSRRHARLINTTAGLRLEDLGSSNGTYVNGQLINVVHVHEGDVITLGNTDLTIREGVLAYLRSENTDDGGGLYVTDLSYRIKSGKTLLQGINIRSRPGTLTAVIGPSGAGKSTLAKVLAGTNAPTTGRVEFDGFNVHTNFEMIRSRIGLVPQDDVLHTSLRVDTALNYAARLRLHTDEDGQTRDAQVNRVIAQLELDLHREKRIDKLSGGQRKRASVALELLTEPSLLILDEPTSGLDPALDRQVMQTLRTLAEGDRSVFVITHSVAYLDMCDDVLILAPGGMPAYYGPPGGIPAFFGTHDWADIFGALAAEPQQAWDTYRARNPEPIAEPVATEQPDANPRTTRMPWVSLFATLTSRQIKLIFADRVYLAFLLMLPIIVGMLVLVVPGSHGLGYAANDAAGEPSQLLAMLIIGSTFMGASISIRDLVGERAIFLRERAVGLPVSAYLASKVLVFGVFAVFMAAVLTLVTFIAKPAPIHAILLSSPVLELFFALALSTFTAMTLGLLLSALVKSNEQVMPLLIIVLMAQLVLNGGLLTLADRPLFYQISNGVLAKWGFAMAASGIDLNGISPALDEDPLWAHTYDVWLLSVVSLVSFAIGFITLTRIRLESRYNQ